MSGEAPGATGLGGDGLQDDPDPLVACPACAAPVRGSGGCHRCRCPILIRREGPVPRSGLWIAGLLPSLVASAILLSLAAWGWRLDTSVLSILAAAGPLVALATWTACRSNIQRRTAVVRSLAAVAAWLMLFLTFIPVVGLLGALVPWAAAGRRAPAWRPGQPDPCDWCGYDLQGRPGQQDLDPPPCPECGGSTAWIADPLEQPCGAWVTLLLAATMCLVTGAGLSTWESNASSTDTAGRWFALALLTLGLGGLSGIVILRRRIVRLRPERRRPLALAVLAAAGAGIFYASMILG